MNRRKLLIWSATNLGAGLVCAGAVSLWTDGETARPGESGEASPVASQPEPREIVQSRAEQLLSRADRETLAAADAALRPIESYFEKAGEGVAPFAECVLGWESKWYLVSDYVREPDHHPQFLAEQFAARVMTTEGLAQAVHLAVARFRQEIERIDNQLLVNLRADVDDLPADLPLAQWDEAEMRERFAIEFQQIQRRVTGQVTSDVGGAVASLVASEVLAAVVRRLCLSGVTVGTGTAAAPLTLGVSLLVGLIMDQIVSWIWDWFADPVGNLTAEVQGRLDTVRDQIISGSEEQPGLRPRLRELAQRHGGQRRQALQALIKKGTRP